MELQGSKTQLSYRIDLDLNPTVTTHLRSIQICASIVLTLRSFASAAPTSPLAITHELNNYTTFPFAISSSLCYIQFPLQLSFYMYSYN